MTGVIGKVTEFLKTFINKRFGDVYSGSYTPWNRVRILKKKNLFGRGSCLVGGFLDPFSEFRLCNFKGLTFINGFLEIPVKLSSISLVCFEF